MTEAGSTLTRHDLEAKIVKHCWEDEEFRKEFTADPMGTFIRYLQVPRAGLPKIVIHEEEPGSWHIVLPSKPASTDELSEEDLEKVAGGTTPVSGVVSVISLTVHSASIIGTVSATITIPVGGW
jgi:hypothetical protein